MTNFTTNTKIRTEEHSVGSSVLYSRPIKPRRKRRKKWRSNPALKERLSERQNHRCCYCGERMTFTGNDERQATVEHVIERRLGGSDGMENLVSCCLTCNLHRNEMKVSAEAYFSYVRENGRFINGKKFLKKEATCTIQEFGNSTTSRKRPPLLLRILRYLKGLFLL